MLRPRSDQERNEEGTQTSCKAIFVIAQKSRACGLRINLCTGEEKGK